MNEAKSSMHDSKSSKSAAPASGYVPDYVAALDNLRALRGSFADSAKWSASQGDAFSAGVSYLRVQVLTDAIEFLEATQDEHDDT